MTEVLMTLQLPTALQEQLYVARSSGDDAQTIQSSQNHDMKWHATTTHCIQGAATDNSNSMVMMLDSRLWIAARRGKLIPSQRR